MKILVDSHFFYPSIGGVETMGRGLVEAWQSLGHAVRVVTDTPLDAYDELTDIDIVRAPTLLEVVRLMHWADVCFRNGNSMRRLLGPLLTGTPFVTRHARPLLKKNVGPYRSLFEKGLTHLGMNVATSATVEETIPGPVRRIPNTFRPVFDQPDAGEEGREEFLFVGRLTKIKGVDIALEALSLLHKQGADVSLMLCGDGPARARLERQADQLGVRSAVTFNGWTSPEELAEQYRSRAVLLVPSRMEAFGIVAIEAIASGCPVVASATGGLPDSVGACGLLVEPERPEALACAMQKALQPETRKTLLAAMPAHVARHRMDQITAEYVALLESVTAHTAL